MSVVLETTEGNIVIDLWCKQQEILCLNFLKLCQLKYYFFTPFYGLHKDRLVLSGNREYPEKDPCYAINHFVDIAPYGEVGDYLTVLPLKAPPDTSSSIGDVGIVSALVNSPDEVIGSQFSICLSSSYADVASLSKQIPFGNVVEGFTVLQKINDSSIDIHDKGRFVNDIRITHTHIIHDPFSKVTIPNEKIFSSEWPSKSQLQNIRLKTSEKMEPSDFYELSLELLDKRANYRIKPSPETLFIGKLNSITTSDSLSTIFARFGDVKNANVIYDKETQRSLCYGFVEFETQAEAENAYLKLHKGCIIDGRQAVVDFSQLSYRSTSHS